MMGRYGWGYGMTDTYHSWLADTLALLMVAVLVAFVVGVILWATRTERRGGWPSYRHPSWLDDSPGDEAKRIARRRLANGEITSQQYEEIMRTLGHSGRPSPG